MNKPKAPKDMTMAELLEQYKHDHNCACCKFDKYCERTEAPIIKSGESIPDCCLGRVWFEERIKEPAPNPFTPDQIAWMREMQRSGYHYAAMDHTGITHVFGERPIQMSDYCWRNTDSIQVFQAPKFIHGVLCVDDPEPLCFADFAPLEVTK